MHQEIIYVSETHTRVFYIVHISDKIIFTHQISHYYFDCGNMGGQPNSSRDTQDKLEKIGAEERGRLKKKGLRGGVSPLY